MTYTLHISLYDAAFFAMLVTGIVFVLQLWFKKDGNRAANRYLSLALLSMVLWLAGIIGADLKFWVGAPQFLLPYGPFVYLYVRTAVYPQFRFRPKDLLCFISLLLVSLNFPAVVLGSVGVYLLVSWALIQRYYRNLKFMDGDRTRREWRWLERLLAGVALATVLGWPLLLALMILGMGVAVYFRTEKTFFPLNSSPLSLRRKGSWLKSVVKAERYYLDPELDLSSLAQKLGMHTHELSRIINTALKKNFTDFINEFRVREAARKMHDPAFDHLSLLGIAYESGFNSQSSFSRIFKQMTGKSPAEYKNIANKDFPSYKLGRPAMAAAVVSHQKIYRYFMIRNYLKVAWRNLLRSKSYTIINMTGLSIGIAACLLIFLVVRYETSFDTFHTKKDQIYRVVGVTKKPSYSLSSGVAFPVPEALRLDFPQLKQVATILRNEGSVVSVGDKKFKEDETYYAGPEFFQTFDFAWLAGDRKTALAEPNTGALTRDEANRLFGDWRQGMGKTLRYKNKIDFKITGILENVPANSDFPLKIVLSYATLLTKGADYDARSSDWGWVIGEHYCFVTLPQGADVPLFNRQLDAFIKRHIPARYADAAGMQLQPLTEMHYDTRIDIFTGHPFSRALITGLSLIGLFLLVIACVNFINLATAQAVNRSKEVGIRKVLGSDRPQLVLQFMSETFILTLSALLIGTVAAAFCLTLLNQLLETHLSLSLLISPAVLLFLLLALISVTFLAGFYPALVLSGFNPIEALRNKIKAGRSSGISLRRVLVVFQFGIAQVLLIGTLVIISQLNYFKNKSLGYNRDAIVTIPIPNDSLSKTRQASLRNELLQQPGVEGVSFSYGSPSDENAWFSSIHFDNSSKETDFGVSLKWADADYFKLYKLQFVAGGPYTAADSLNGYVINEALVRKLGLKSAQQAIGKTINLGGNARINFPITGVVRDYITGSLKDAVPPVLMGSYKGSYRLLNVKLKPDQLGQTLTKIQQQFNAAFPDALYEYNFVDDQVARFYKTDTQLSQLYQIAAGIAILISCLGLFGLVSFMAVQRTKEVGIRKTLGASVGHIVYLFSREFTILVLVAFAIASPVGYYLMQQWLQSFAYRIRLGPGIFLLAITFSVVIAWLTVGYKAVQAALANPVKSLRSE